MSAHFHVNVGPFTIDVELDDSGIRMQRGPVTKSIAWEKITGATLVRQNLNDNESFTPQQEQLIAEFAGQHAVEEIRGLQGTVGQVFVAYHDEKNRLQQTEVPAPLADPAFLQEFQSRLGNRWLGETHGREQVARKLHSNPGFFKTIFVLMALFAIIAVVAAIAMLGFLGPVLNFMSIQKMLLDLQDGNYPSLVSRLATYAALFFLGFFLHRIIRSELDAMKARFRFRGNRNP
jgi:hypothetical protein